MKLMLDLFFCLTFFLFGGGGAYAPNAPPAYGPGVCVDEAWNCGSAGPPSVSVG